MFSVFKLTIIGDSFDSEILCKKKFILFFLKIHLFLLNWFHVTFLAAKHVYGMWPIREQKLHLLDINLHLSLLLPAHCTQNKFLLFFFPTESHIHLFFYVNYINFMALNINYILLNAFSIANVIYNFFSRSILSTSSSLFKIFLLCKSLTKTSHNIQHISIIITNNC